MGLDIFFLEDIRNALLAANEASAQTAAQVPVWGDCESWEKLRAYREGYKAALVTMALAFGIAPQAVFPPWREPADEAPEIPAQAEQALPPSAWGGR